MKNKKENTIIVNSSLFLFMAALHSLYLICGIEVVINGFILPMLISVVGAVLLIGLAVLNLSLIKTKSQIFWLKFVFALFVFDALFVLCLWLNSVSCGIFSVQSFIYIFIFDIILLSILAFYINKFKK